MVSYQNWIAGRMPLCDAYIALSGSGLAGGIKAKSNGAIYIMDRGSSHIRTSVSIASEEHRRWDIPYNKPHPRLIENEEAEADEATAITVPSTYAKMSFVDQGISSEKIYVIPYGVNLNEFKPMGDPPADRFRLLFVGKASVGKGIPYLVQAFKDFRHPRKELVIVGAVSPEIHQLCAAIGLENIRFAGVVPRKSVANYMSTSHALVLPSLDEGMALVQAQAMACKCPVIATPNTGALDLFTDQIEGMIVPTRDANALTEAFVKLADDQDLQLSMRDRAFERASQLGGWKTYAKEVICLVKLLRGSSKK